MASDVHRMQAKSEANEFEGPGVLVDPPRYDERAWARVGTKVQESNHHTVAGRVLWKAA